MLFAIKRAEWGVEVFPELRTQTQSRRFRVPDVLVTRTGDKFERYVTQPPLIAIETLSPGTRSRPCEPRLRSFGAENIWITDPEPRNAWRYSGAALEEVNDGELSVPGTPIRVVLAELLAELEWA